MLISIIVAIIVVLLMSPVFYEGKNEFINGIKVICCIAAFMFLVGFALIYPLLPHSGTPEHNYVQKYIHSCFGKRVQIIGLGWNKDNYFVKTYSVNGVINISIKKDDIVNNICDYEPVYTNRRR